MFWYLFVETSDAEVLVWNPPRRLEPLIREINEQQDGGVGTVLAITRDGFKSNSPIDAHIVDYREAEELEIDAFVRTLGNNFDLTQSLSDPISAARHEARVNVTS